MSKDNFINPVPNSRVKRTSTKTVKLTPTDSNKVVSPYDGVIIENDNIIICSSEKDNRFIIRHRVSGKYFYSVICNVNQDSSYKPGRTQINVSQGDEIGSVLNNKSTFFTILDDNTDEVMVDSFLSSSDDKDKKEKEDKNKKEKEDKNKKENNTTSTSSSKDSIAKDWLVGVPSELFKLATMAFKGNPEKKETSENIKLKEEIERIKSLLK
jgi:hypothetical protein